MKRYGLVLMLGIALIGNAEAGKKTYICHKGETIKVSNKAVDAHLGHGDVVGRCEDLPREQVVVIFRCATGIEGGLAVSDVSVSENAPEETPAVIAGDNCADANAVLLNNGFDLGHVTAGATSEGLQTEYFYSGEFLIIEEPVVE